MWNKVRGWKVLREQPNTLYSSPTCEPSHGLTALGKLTPDIFLCKEGCVSLDKLVGCFWPSQEVYVIHHSLITCCTHDHKLLTLLKTAIRPLPHTYKHAWPHRATDHWNMSLKEVANAKNIQFYRKIWLCSLRGSHKQATLIPLKIQIGKNRRHDTTPDWWLYPFNTGWTGPWVKGN